ncbi:flagellar filament capping protein FliD [Sphingomonas sp. 1P08PE]|uniref:flagellar filament capping protein FliD n=1 Tax=Sphingomonas sp. 1P08PE TaxID=554122 RepID=UPI0039A15AA9
MTTISESITKTLGTGSGVDTKALVKSLVEAQFAAKNALLTKQTDTLTSQISGVAKLKAGITGFDTALKALVKGGTLTTQPSSSNTGVARLSLQSGASAIGLSAQLTVSQLAAPQAATTNTAVPATQPFRGGTLTVNIGSYVTTGGTTTLSPTKSVPITVPQDATLDQIATQIRKETGLQTSLVNDNGGVRLTIKGATGAAQAFEIVGADADGTAAGQGLASLSVGGNATGTTIGSAARDALLTLDGASFSRATNSITDLLPGINLDLVATSTTPVTLAATSPGSALTQAVEDVVATFNELQSLIKEETNNVDGVLRGDPVAAALGRSLAQLTLAKLTTSTTGGPQTLADLGVSTDTDKRDGSLKLDSKKLAAVMARDPAGVEAIFAVDAAGKGGLTEVLSGIAAKATDKTFGLDAATARYTKTSTTIAEQKTKVSDAATAMTNRLTQQYAAMDARVAAYKASQTFLEQQIKAWNQSDN